MGSHYTGMDSHQDFYAQYIGVDESDHVFISLDTLIQFRRIKLHSEHFALQDSLGEIPDRFWFPKPLEEFTKETKASKLDDVTDASDHLTLDSEGPYELEYLAGSDIEYLLLIGNALEYGPPFSFGFEETPLERQAGAYEMLDHSTLIHQPTWQPIQFKDGSRIPEEKRSRNRVAAAKSRALKNAQKTILDARNDLCTRSTALKKKDCKCCRQRRTG